MNTYEYRCENCQHEFETQQHFKDKPLTKCPECEQDTLERLISSPSVISMGPQTLGGFAEKKTAKMGRYHRDKVEKEAKERREKANDHIAEEAAKLGGKPINKNKVKKPWYSKGAPSNKKLSKLTNKQKMDYIMKGKLPK